MADIYDGNWHGWSGGRECPLEDGVLVDIIIDCSDTIFEGMICNDWNWLLSGEMSIVAFKVLPEDATLSFVIPKTPTNLESHYTLDTLQ